MKKVLSIATAALCGVTMFAAVACGDATPPDGKTYTVYAPDGAPALALSKGISADNDKFDFHIVDPNKTQMAALVSGNTPAADFCVLPVNVAAKVLGTGTTYQMLGTVTNGNMYFLTVNGTELTPENYETTLVGKTVGVVQIANVPGLVFRHVLADTDYQILQNDTQADANKINLKPISDPKTEVSPAGGCDYYLCPEPVASAKVKGTATAPKPLVFAGDLQELYGEGGYPQAVLVAKKSVIAEDKAAVDTMIGYMNDVNGYLNSADPATVAALLAESRVPGMDNPTLTAANLTSQVIANCSVRFTASSVCKAKVNAFLAELIAVDAQFTKAVEDGFYYAG